ncbi:hypothetical protein [Paracholeplasma manati]|uniref:hypothetical protein n=1 Tax=Paracholeplasma manati TaxID=591373 RepID=UPI002408591D|nr:hypothetical protein [Paracholeplasma manati]MDG0888299.1 hypothetical protein [Paracholeplasma manati]
MENGLSNDYNRIIRQIINKLKEKQLITFELIEIKSIPKLEALIHKLAQDRIVKIKNDYETYTDYVLIITSLSLIAMDSYNGNFWNHVYDKYQVLYDKPSENKQSLDSRIRNVIKYFLPNDYKMSTTIGWILQQSIVPKEYMMDFYNILSIVYFYDLRHEIPEDHTILEGLLKTIFKQIEKRTTQDDDTIQSHVMNQSYKFILSTRTVVTNPRYRNTLATFSRFVILSIAEKVNYGEIWKDIPDFFKGWANEWFLVQGKHKVENTLSSSNKGATQIRWKVDYNFENQRLVLNTKTVFLPPDIDHSKIKIEIFSNGQSVYLNDSPRILENQLSYELTSLPIIVDFDPFNIMIKVHGFDIKEEKIESTSLLFDIQTGKRVVSKYSDYPALYVLSKSFESDNIADLSSTEYYKIGILDTSKLDYFKSNNRIETIKEKTIPFLLGDIVEQCAFKLGQSHHPIVTNKLTLHFSSEPSVDSYMIWVNLKFLVIENTSNLIEVEIPNDLLQIGPNEIYVTDNMQNKLKQTAFKLYYDPRFRYEIKDNHLYFYSTRITKRVKDIPELPVVEIPLDDGMSFIINPFIPMMKHGNTDFHTIGEYLWHEDFSFYDTLVFKGIKATYVRIYNTSTGAITNPINSTKDSFYGLIFSLNSTDLKSSKENLSLNFYDKESIVTSIPYLNHSVVDEEHLTLVELGDKVVEYQVGKIYGKGDYRVQVYVNKENSGLFNVNQVPYTLNYKYDDFGEFLFILKDGNETIHKDELFVFDPNWLEGKLVRIREVNLSTTDKSNRLWNYTQYSEEIRRSYIKINENLDDGQFEGEIVYKDKISGYVTYVNIDSVIIYIDFPIKNRKSITANIVTFDDQPLFYDRFTHKIMDTNDEPKTNIVSTIDEYIIEIEDIYEKE